MTRLTWGELKYVTVFIATRVTEGFLFMVVVFRVCGGGFSWLSFRGRQWVAGNCLIMDTWCVRTLQPSLSWLLPAWERLTHCESALSPFSCSVSSERSPGYALWDNQGTCFGSLLLFWIKMLAELRLPLQGGSRRAKDSSVHQTARISSSYISSACGMESEQLGKKKTKTKKSI